MTVEDGRQTLTSRRQFEVVTSMNRSAVHQLPVQLEVHDLHFKNMRGKNSVKDKALFTVDFKALLQSQLEYIQEISL